MIRLVIPIALFLLSLLAVFNAPAYYLWLMAIAVTEYPLVFVAITIVVLLTGFWMRQYNMAGSIAGILALLLFLSPIARAYKVAATLPDEMDASFGKSTLPPQKPFSWLKLFSSVQNSSYKTFTYANYTDIQLNLDFYSAHAKGNKPCVVVIHGGSWSSGDSKQLSELNTYLAKAGYNVAAINYRMAPKYKSPLQIEDVKNALNYLRQHADSLHIDTTQFVLLGRSAGAQIALLAGYTLKDAGIKGVIDFYGPADMVWGYSLPANPLVMDSRAVMENYLGGTYTEVPQNYAASSPIAFVNPNSPPTLIIHGANDVLVAYEHSRRLNEKLEQNGIKHFWLKLPWATHGFDYNLNGPGGQLSTYAVGRFLDFVTKRPSQ
ncbi:alpha/beta hydrolase [Mucilaginibacter auburnensis]|uniref:Acetyl esterase/lipase n=1 Tax=Mucilaginibacter auburnensis TaxID=1457233 RepID=A0A2H9VRP4_9SPHI|nr:alpha/beta hydrolase [Mucilaginibacter auburnensis]PJJ83482.1 acetyl esterase/lipase [Mucilaginibacter auburnensis]